MLRPTGIHCTADARALAKRRLPRMVFDYFDGAAGEGLADQRNRQALQDMCLQPKVLRNVEVRSLAAKIFDEDTDLPFGISPMGMCNLACPGADTMLARMAADFRIPLGVSTAASTPMEDLIDAAQGHAWFQLYYSGDKAASNVLLTRARDCGYKTLVLTTDVAEIGRRPRELRWDFKMPFRIGVKQFIDLARHPRWSLNTLYHGAPQLANFLPPNPPFERTRSRAGADFDFLAWLRDQWQGKLVVKGVSSVEDAKMIQAAGVDAIQVSNHGGRQIESAPSAVHALQAIRAAVGEEYPLFFDSGLRNGEDVIKSYAAGADFAFLGRPLLFAMGADGERGLGVMREVLQAEISIGLALLGLSRVEQIDTSVIYAAAS